MQRRRSSGIPGEPGIPTAIFLGFTRALRAAGVQVTQDRAHGFLQATAIVGAGDPVATYTAGRATLCAGPDDLRRYDQVFEDPAVRYLEPILEFDHPQAGRIRLVAPPVRYSAWQPRATRVPPDVGEDTGGVLKDLGYSPEDLAQLHRDGVIG